MIKAGDYYEVDSMNVFEYGEREAESVLVQMVDENDMALLNTEVEEIRKKTTPFSLIAVKVDSWNSDLSPWPAPQAFGNESFGDGAGATLQYVLSLCSDKTKNYYIGGYSLAGLFALWSVTQTDTFKGVAAASPSVWFPGFTDFLRNNSVRTQSVYLSLGDRESKTRNKTMGTVADRIIDVKDIITSQNIECFFEWNEGGHFKNPDKRTANAFAYLLNSGK